MTLKSRIKHFFRFRFPALVWALVIFGASSISSIKLPKISIFSPDKLAHISVFFVLGYCVFRAFEPEDRNPALKWSRFFFSFIIASSYGALDEVHQLFVPGRSFDYYDMLADAVGVLVALLVAFGVGRWRVRKVASKSA